MANNDDGGAQGGFPDEDSRIRFSNELDHLRNNAKTKFEFRRAWFGAEVWRPTSRWTSHHATQVVEALVANTSVTVLDVDLQFCSVSAIPLFLDFIQSTPRLEELVVSYYHRYFNDNEETRFQYDDQMSYIFRAILQNPSIKKFTVRGAFGLKTSSQRALFDLLSSTTTLTFFGCKYQGRIHKEVAFAMAGGLARNSSIVKANLGAGQGPIDIVISGIGFASPIESLTMGHPTVPSADFYLAISKMLHITPSLKTLEVGCDHYYVEVDTGSPVIDQVFWDLRQSACSGLEKLVLDQVCFGTPNATLSLENCNRNVQILNLRYVHFPNRDAVRLLWSLVGLKKLLVRMPFYLEEEEEEEEREGPDCWGELIRMNKNLLEVDVCDTHSWEHCTMGIVQGAYKHESLQTLRLDLDFVGDDNNAVVNGRIGAQLGQLVRGNNTLQKFILNGAEVSREAATQLTDGMGHNKTLKSIDLGGSNLDHEAWKCVERSLLQDGPNKMSASSICLPSATVGGLRVVKPFLQSLPHMPFIKEAAICASLGSEEKLLLLQAAKDKKTLMSFKTEDSENEARCRVENEIDFTLKLNRFGRQILDHTNVCSSLWPILLCRMASERKNADALHFFLGQYFANYSDGGNEQPPAPLPQQQQHLEQSTRPRKYARLE